MTTFILNDLEVSTSLPLGTTVLDFARYHQNLKGTKIGCREGDCGACTILVGELVDDRVRYRSMTSCLMPLANAAGKHIVTIEGINPEDGSLTPVQQALVGESGTQCGFCTVGFVMSLTGFCIDDAATTPEMAVSSIDGNICRCTGYKSIERAAARICEMTAAQRSPNEEGVAEGRGGSLRQAIEKMVIPSYFHGIAGRLKALTATSAGPPEDRTQSLHEGGTRGPFVGGGTDLYVQRPETMVEAAADHLFYQENLRAIRDTGEFIEIGASATVTDLLVSPVMQEVFPDLFKHLKLVSSTPIRNMATLAGNFVNASPIGDMTVWFLALDAEIELRSPASSGGNATVRERASRRTTKLRDFYLSYKQLAKSDDEYITSIRFKKPGAGFRFNFEKVCKRTYLDIATVNTAISLTVSGPTAPAGGSTIIKEAHLSAGGVAPIPLYLIETSSFLRNKEICDETIAGAVSVMQSEISPISDVRGTADYKRVLLSQLFKAHFVELFSE